MNDRTDRRPSEEPLPPLLVELEAELARMTEIALAAIRADEEAAAEAYAALPWWRRQLVNFCEWRWRLRFRRKTGRDPYPTRSITDPEGNRS